MWYFAAVLSTNQWVTQYIKMWEYLFTYKVVYWSSPPIIIIRKLLLVPNWKFLYVHYTLYFLHFETLETGKSGFLPAVSLLNNFYLLYSSQFESFLLHCYLVYNVYRRFQTGLSAAGDDVQAIWDKIVQTFTEPLVN